MWSHAFGEAASTEKAIGIVARVEERWPEICEFLDVEDWEQLFLEGVAAYQSPYRIFCNLISYDWDHVSDVITANDYEHRLKRMKTALPEVINLIDWYYESALSLLPVNFYDERVYRELQSGKITHNLEHIESRIDDQLEQLRQKNYAPRTVLDGGKADNSDLCYWCANLLAFFKGPACITKTRNGVFHRFCCLISEIITGEERSLARAFELAAIEFHERSREYGLERL